MNSRIEEGHVVSLLDRYIVNKNKIKYRISYEFILLLILFYFGLDTYYIYWEKQEQRERGEQREKESRESTERMRESRFIERADIYIEREQI